MTRVAAFLRAAALGGALVAALAASPARALADLERYENSNDPMATTPSTDESAFGAWHNPAVWAIPERAMFDVGVFDAAGPSGSGILQNIDGWQLGAGRGLGFGVRHRDSSLSDSLDFLGRRT